LAIFSPCFWQLKPAKSINFLNLKIFHLKKKKKVVGLKIIFDFGVSFSPEMHKDLESQYLTHF